MNDFVITTRRQVWTIANFFDFAFAKTIIVEWHQSCFMITVVASRDSTKSLCE
jgi:hypothetical protein